MEKNKKKQLLWGKYFFKLWNTQRKQEERKIMYQNT